MSRLHRSIFAHRRLGRRKNLRMPTAFRARHGDPGGDVDRLPGHVARRSSARSRGLAVCRAADYFSGTPWQAREHPPGLQAITRWWGSRECRASGGLRLASAFRPCPSPARWRSTVSVMCRPHRTCADPCQAQAWEPSARRIAEIEACAPGRTGSGLQDQEQGAASSW